MIFDDPIIQITRRIGTIEKQIRELFLRTGGAVYTQSKDVMGGHGVGGSVPAGLTYYIVPFVAGLDTVGRSFPWPVGGTLKNLYVRLASAQPATGNLVFTLVDVTLGISTGITVTIPAGSAAGTYSDLVNTYIHTAGNLLALYIQNNAAANSAVIGGCAWSIEYGLV